MDTWTWRHNRYDPLYCLRVAQPTWGQDLTSLTQAALAARTPYNATNTSFAALLTDVARTAAPADQAILTAAAATLTAHRDWCQCYHWHERESGEQIDAGEGLLASVHQDGTNWFLTPYRSGFYERVSLSDLAFARGAGGSWAALEMSWDPVTAQVTFRFDGHAPSVATRMSPRATRALSALSTTKWARPLEFGSTRVGPRLAARAYEKDPVAAELVGLLRTGDLVTRGDLDKVLDDTSATIAGLTDEHRAVLDSLVEHWQGSWPDLLDAVDAVLLAA